MTKCMNCNDNRVVWTTGDFGMATAGPCPKCNLNGSAVNAEFKELEKKWQKQIAKLNGESNGL